MASMNEKAETSSVRKNSSSFDVECNGATTARPHGPLKRQMKNRHISMIRSALLFPPDRSYTIIDITVQYRRRAFELFLFA